jgi:hypothetical protein
VYYAIWFTLPRIYGRQWETYRENGQVEINDEDLQFASIIYEAVIYWQDYYFGRMLSDSWQNAKNEVQPRKRITKAAQDFEALPKQFTSEDVAKVINIDEHLAIQRIANWRKSGYIRVVTPNARPKVYEKTVSSIVVC